MITLVASDRLSFDLSEDGRIFVLRVQHRERYNYVPIRLSEVITLELTPEELAHLRALLSYQPGHFL